MANEPRSVIGAGADDERRPPRLIVATPAELGWCDLSTPGRRLVDAGADALLLAAGTAFELAESREAFAQFGRDLPTGAFLMVEDAPALAAAVGCGVLLAERGISTAEARRLLGAGPLLGRAVSSPAAATAAAGADFLATEAVAADPGFLRAVVASSWSPVIVCAASVEEEVAALPAALAAGAEGVLLRPRPRVALDELIEAVAAVRSLLPDVWFESETAEPTIVVDGIVHPLIPDTAITDLLADLRRGGALAVAVNGVQVARGRWDDALLAPGDAVEITGG